VLVVGGVLVLAPIGAATREGNRDSRADWVEELMGDGATRSQAECVADGAEREFGEPSPDFSEAGREELTELMRLVIECQGTTGALSDCVLDGVVDVIGEDNLRGDRFIEATQNTSVDDHVRLVRVGLECGGLPPAVARCVTDMMVEEFGRDTFEAPGLDLTPDQQSRVRAITTECATQG
jgi:hypothetical protein